MANFSLNTGVKEQPRAMEELGFDGMTAHDLTRDEHFPKGTRVQNTDFTLKDEVITSANTVKSPMPTPAGGDYGLRRY